MPIERMIAISPLKALSVRDEHRLIKNARNTMASTHTNTNTTQERILEITVPASASYVVSEGTAIYPFSCNFSAALCAAASLSKKRDACI